jgi:hypothetical protein
MLAQRRHLELAESLADQKRGGQRERREHEAEHEAKAPLFVPACPAASTEAAHGASTRSR